MLLIDLLHNKYGSICCHSDIRHKSTDLLYVQFIVQIMQTLQQHHNHSLYEQLNSAITFQDKDQIQEITIKIPYFYSKHTNVLFTQATAFCSIKVMVNSDVNHRKWPLFFFPSECQVKGDSYSVFFCILKHKTDKTAVTV